MGDHDKKLYNTSLSLISNALRLAKEEGFLSRTVQECPWFIDTLLPVLIENIKYSHLRPQEALYATKTLNALIGASEEAKKTAIQNDAASILITANKFGRNH